MEKKRFYVTTPIYYVNSEPHIGSAYTTIVADMIARYQRLRGYDVYFLTGTDEHGQKILETSQKAGVDVQLFCDKWASKFKELWKDLDISNNDFIRTTQPRHTYVVQAFVKRLFDRGHVYKGVYEGWYCIHEEAFWSEEDLIRDNGRRVCPTCKREVRWVAEDNYFFRLSSFQEPLRELYEKNPSFVEPDFRRNEMLSIIKGGLKDLSISRTSFSWGVPMPDDPKHVIYVWVDALINYISALGYATDNQELYRRYWPADLHLIGKEINRFHSIVWPAMLMAAGLPLPKKVFAHGWLTVNGEKISKSAGNAIDPRLLMDVYGKDAVKYYLLRDINFGKDGDFSEDHLIQRINADLANDLGNLLHRTTAMSLQNFAGVLEKEGGLNEETPDRDLIAAFETMKATYFEKMDRYQFTQALEALWAFIGFSNKYIDMTEPWKLAKEESQRGRLRQVLRNLAEALRNIAIAIKPIMFSTSEIIYKRLGLGSESWNEATFEDFTWDSARD
ncbi:MAG TPA: methionine--tRNA ligase, partial [Thermotogota bacterium]|nr:methionine--tRNA ligase [Thermotogota bacterium]